MEEVFQVKDRLFALLFERLSVMLAGYNIVNGKCLCGVELSLMIYDICPRPRSGHETFACRILNLPRVVN